MNIGIIIQARLRSSRLPEKVLKNLPINMNISVLEQVIRRAKCSRFAKEIIVATTENSEDQTIVDIAVKEKVKYFRGSEKDVLERYYFAAKKNQLDAIVRITSDCPCIDPSIIDQIIEEFLKNKCDFVTNTLIRTYPTGLDAEIFSFKALEKTYYEAVSQPDREHVCTFIESNPNLFNIINISAPEELKKPDLRITLDTYEDYMVLCAIYDYLYEDNYFFTAKDIIKLFDEKPWLSLINNQVRPKRIFKEISEEKSEALKVLELQNLYGIKKLLEDMKLD